LQGLCQPFCSRISHLIVCTRREQAAQPPMPTTIPSIIQPLASSHSLPLPLYLFSCLSCLYSLLFLYCLCAYVLYKSNEMRVEFCCKASASLSAPKAPTPLSGQEENSHPAITTHRHTINQSINLSLPIAPYPCPSISSLSCLYSLLFLY